MHISEFAKPVTAKSLNESLARRYGNRLKLETYSLEQLQDARNKLRTRLSQVEMTENFNSVVESESYQKSKLMLDILNAEITERGDIDEAAKPDYIDLDGDGDKTEPMKKAAKDAEEEDETNEGELKELGVVNRDAMAGLSQAYQGYITGNERQKADAVAELMVRLGMSDPRQNRQPTGRLPSMNLGDSVIREGAEDQAEIVMAAKEMVDRLTGWMEDTAEMQTESMLELADAIRDEMGSQQSQAYVDSIKPALADLYAAMEVTRGALSTGVGMLTGEQAAEPAAPMGAEGDIAMDEPAMEPTVDMEAPADDGEGFAVAGAAAGGEEAAGRARRESVERITKKVIKKESVDSRKLATKLASSKKK